jgi:inner membrane protein
MPSPVGHALGGLTGGWLASGRRPHPGWIRQAALFAIVGMLPDIDLLFGAHNGPTHSVGAALLVGLLAWLALKAGRSRFFPGLGSVTVPLSLVAAYATHILLDYLGSDTSAPYGVMALWPFSQEYFLSPVPIFPAITRRYWLEGFLMQNLRALAFELAVLGPIAIGVWWARRQPRGLR